MGVQLNVSNIRQTRDQLQPARLVGRFTLAGTSAPTVDTPRCISVVTRYTTAGGEPFYRVSLLEKWPLSKTSAIVLASIATIEGRWANVVRKTDLVPSGGSAADAVQEIDLVVYEGATIGVAAATNSLTGPVVQFEALVDQIT